MLKQITDQTIPLDVFFLKKKERKKLLPLFLQLPGRGICLPVIFKIHTKCSIFLSAIASSKKILPE